MKKLELLLIAFLISNTIIAQNITTQKFNSLELGSQRTIKIYLPPEFDPESTDLYPLTVVLDAEFLFDVVVGNAILFANKDEAPPQIIVGIEQNRRNERYADSSFNIENSLPTAEGQQFYNFIGSELMNYMDENYPISPFRTIIGNTVTANFINYFFLEQYPTFSAYVAINPYYAIDIPSMILNRTSGIKDENIYYYLSNGPYNVEKRKVLIEDTNNILSDIVNPFFKYKYDVFANSTKTASIGQSVAGAFAFIFELYSKISKEEFEKNVQNLSPPDAIAYLENKYVEIEYLFGTSKKIRETDIYAIESIILDKENGDYLKNFGEMINKLYEESPLGDYYIGKYYEIGKKYKQALKYYKNGYGKLPPNDPNSDGYYQNIERVLKKRDGLIVDPE